VGGDVGERGKGGMWDPWGGGGIVISINI